MERFLHPARLLPVVLLLLQPFISQGSVWDSTIIITRPTVPSNLISTNLASPRPSGPPGPVIFCPGFPPLPTNDAFADATVLRGYGTGICGATALIQIVGIPNWQATAETGEPNHCGLPAANSVWYRWTAPASGVVEMKTAALIAVYTGGTLGTLVPVASCPDGQILGATGVKFTAIRGQTYQIAIDRPILATPLGDFPLSPGQFNLTIQLATMELVSPPSTNMYIAGQPIQFEFAPLDEQEGITQLSLVVDGDVIETLTNAPWQFAYAPTNAGNVSVWAEGVGTNGHGVIAWPTQFSFRPANDDFADATVIGSEVTGGTFSGSVINATAEPGEPPPAPGASPVHSIWWKWTAPYSAETKITLLGSGMLTGFQGESLGTLQTLFHLESSGIIIISFPPFPPSNTTFSFFAQAGETYYFAADNPDAAPVFASLGSTVSWSLEQKTLTMEPAGTQRGRVGAPVALTATSIEAGNPAIEFMLGQQTWLFPSSWPQITPVASLGIVDSPPYEILWVPAVPGTFYVWARSTNNDGFVHQSDTTLFQIYAANDDFAWATEIPPGTVSTNIPFGFVGTSVESNEPPHRLGDTFSTLWWKWTPSYSGAVRLHAAKTNGAALLVEIFTGDDLSNLKLLEASKKVVARSGISDLVAFQAQAGVTYYIRVDQDPRLPRVLNPLNFGPPEPEAVLTLEPADAAVGQIAFSLIAQTIPPHGRQPARTARFARVFMPDGKTPVTDPNFVAQLYVGDTASDLQPVGNPQPFFNSLDKSLAGVFVPAVVNLPDFAPGERVFAQIRVWNSDLGDTYDAATGAGSPFGISGTIRVVVGSAQTGPAKLSGIHSFALQNPAP